MEIIREPGYWANHQRMKWHLYELAKKQLRWREMKGDDFDWDRELAKVIERLKL